MGASEKVAATYHPNTGPSAAEQAVRDIDELRRELRQLEDYMRNLRLDRKVGTVGDPEQVRVRRLRWLPGVYGFGWFESKAEPMPEGMSGEFYRYLGQRARDVGGRLNAAEAALRAVEVPRG